MINATTVSGTAKRTVRAIVSTSPVVRDTRSPVPARSTVDSGSASTRCMKVSRSSAKTPSPMTNDDLAGRAGEHGLREHEASQDSRERVDSARGGPFGDGVDQGTEQPRPGKSGKRGADVQHQRPGQLAAAGAQ